MLLPQADAVEKPDWEKDVYEPDFGSETLLHDARLHAAPAVKKQ